jgi:catechol 2,3-dioxygenase-like lactoylglutathione lyase family enzyme
MLAARGALQWPHRGGAMSVKLNHTIVHAHDQAASAAFYAEILGLPPATRFGPFLCIQVDNEVTLDILETDEEIQIQHYAFLISEPEFDVIFGRIKARGLTHWADPMCKQAGAINHHDGGRGVYFKDPGGNLLEIITRPYGSG